jgi:hypothetical protein
MAIGKKANGGDKSKLISVYVPLELFSKLSRKAVDEDRPLSKTVARILTDAMRNE